MKSPVSAGRQAPPKKSSSHRQAITIHSAPGGVNVAGAAARFASIPKRRTILIVTFLPRTVLNPPNLSMTKPPKKTPETGAVAEVMINEIITTCFS